MRFREVCKKIANFFERNRYKGTQRAKKGQRSPGYDKKMSLWRKHQSDQ
jgi:hypothetical protein